MSGRYDSILALLDAVPVGNGFWKARCPVHQGQPRNLRLWIGRKGNLMVGCWRCHGHAAGLAKVLWLQQFSACTGIRMNELFADDDKNDNKKTERRPQVVATFVYEDELGRPLYRKLRYEPKSFSQDRWDASEGRWRPGLGPHPELRRVLFRLPKLLANPTAVVHVVEGEGKVLALEKCFLTATCCCEGSALWLDDYSRCLAGRSVVLWPDNDSVGRRFMDQVAGSLVRHGASSLAVIDIARHLEASGTKCPAGYDVKDFVEEGVKLDHLFALIGNALVWTPE